METHETEIEIGPVGHYSIDDDDIHDGRLVGKDSLTSKISKTMKNCEWALEGCQQSKKASIAHDLQSFFFLCYTATRAEEIFALVDLYEKLYSLYIYVVKHTYNNTIGWALPSRLVCSKIMTHWQEHVLRYPEARLVDAGAGSGIFSFMFHSLGISKVDIVALDLEKPTHSSDEQRKFWPIVTQYDIQPTDLLFVAWGSNIYNVVDKYVKNGGTCVIILGEANDGCTFPSDYFLDTEKNEKGSYDKEDEDTRLLKWQVELTHVLGPASQHNEYLSINTRY